MPIEKIKRPKKIQVIDRMQPQNIEVLIRKYNAELDVIYDFLDTLVDYIKSKEQGGG